MRSWREACDISSSGISLSRGRTRGDAARVVDRARHCSAPASFANAPQLHSCTKTWQTLPLPRGNSFHFEAHAFAMKNWRADWFHKPTFERAIKITGGQLIILLRNHNVNLTHFVNTNTNADASVSKRTSTFIARPNEILRSSFIKAI